MKTLLVDLEGEGLLFVSVLLVPVLRKVCGLTTRLDGDGLAFGAGLGDGRGVVALGFGGVTFLVSAGVNLLELLRVLVLRLALLLEGRTLVRSVLVAEGLVLVVVLLFTVVELRG
jgi:hypothetical protein